MFQSKKVGVVVPAAGIGKRMGAAYPEKQFLSLGGKPLLAHSLAMFQALACIDEIAIAVSAERLAYVQDEVIRAWDLNKVRHIVVGGKERQDSVWAAFQALPDAEIVIVHDAARPLVSEAVIMRTVEAAVQHGAAIAAVRIHDTIKEGKDGFVEKTIDRARLWAVQTPQAFSKEVLARSFSSAQKDGFYGTDESMLVERTGYRVAIVEGDPRNIKVTTPEDVRRIENWLAEAPVLTSR